MEWIVGIIASILSLLGIGKLLELAFKARQERRAAKALLDTTNAGKEIDADVNAFNSISKRLELVESRLDTVHTQLMDQKVENAKLEAENVRLTKDNERQEKEIERQRERLHDLANKINGKDLVMTEMRVALEKSNETIATLRDEVHELSRRLNGSAAGG